MPLRPQLTEDRITLLRLIARYRSLSSTQIYQEAHTSRLYTSILRDLRRLREMGLITSHPLEPERGTNSELVWMLLKGGADAIGVTDYDRHYRRKPARTTIAQRSVELELARQVEAAGWQLIRPATYSSRKPLPPETPQAQRLREAAGYAESRAIEALFRRDSANPTLETRRRDYSLQMYRHSIPAQINDHVAFVAPPGGEVQAVALILCPERASTKFWQVRVTAYRDAVARVPVIALFATVEQEGPYRDMIKAGGIKVTTVENVRRALDSLRYRS